MEAALYYGSTLAKALTEVHAQGIIVADLKPENVLLTEQGEPVLADFSTSRIVTNTLGQFTNTKAHGTLHYM